MESTGKLIDADDLHFTEEFLDDDGMPDRTKIEQAVTALVARKPHLARIRPAGDVGQGARGEVAAPVNLADMLRAGAG